MEKQRLKITDKEIYALVKKVQAKQKNAVAKKDKEAAKKFYPEAQKLIKQLNEMPDYILQWLYNNRYNCGKVDKQALAIILLKKNEDYEVEAIQTTDEIESDIVLAAYSCKTLSELCYKLGI